MSETISVQDRQSPGGGQTFTVKAGLHAGILGAVAMTLLGLLSAVGPQFLKLATCGLLFGTLVIVGLMAGHLLGAARTGRQGAAAGAIAGILAGAGGAFGLAAVPLDASFSQNMEVLCASMGGCGLWSGGVGIIVAFISFFLLLFFPALALSSISGALYGWRSSSKNKRDQDARASLKAETIEEDDALAFEEPAHKTTGIKIIWPAINLGAAVLLLIVMGLLAGGQILYIFQHGSVPSGRLLLAGALAFLFWIAAMVSLFKWHAAHPFRVWLGVMVWPLLLFFFLIGACPSCKWGQRAVVQGDSELLYENISFSGNSQVLAYTTGKIWVNDVVHDEVQIIDRDRKQVTGSIPVGADPIGIAAGENAVWVVSEGSYEVYRLDPQQLSVEAVIPIPGRPLLAAAGAGGVWVSLPDNHQVVRIDPDHNAVADTIAVRPGPSSLAVDEHFIWVANQNDHTVTCIDPTTNSIDKVIDVGSMPSFVDVSDDAVWVAVQGIEEVVRIDKDEREVVARIPVGGVPMTLVSDNGSVWVSLINEDAVVQIDAQTNQLVGDPIPVGKEPMGLIADGSSIWVANFGDGTLGRIETLEQLSTDHFSTGDIPFIYLVSLFNFLGRVAVAVASSLFIWLFLLVLGTLLGRFISASHGLQYGFIVAAGLIIAWLAYRLITVEIALGIVAASIAVYIVLRKMKEPVLVNTPPGPV